MIIDFEMKRFIKFKEDNMIFISNYPKFVVSDYNSNYLWLEFV